MTRTTSRLSLALLLGGIAAVAVAQPPVAPPPQPVPTTPGGLIVGKWKLTKDSELSLTGSHTVIVHEESGKYYTVQSNRFDPVEKVTVRGWYILRDSVLTWTTNKDEVGQVKVIRLNRQELVVEGPGGFKGQTQTYIRVRD